MTEQDDNSAIDAQDDHVDDPQVPQAVTEGDELVAGDGGVDPRFENTGSDGPVANLFVSPEDSDVELVSESTQDAPTNMGVAALTAKLAELEAERDDFKNRLLRTAADLENFRKRAAREREDMRKYGIDKVVLELLPVIDNLDRALEHADKLDAQSASIVDGVQMVHRQFLSSLEKHGVTSFDARGEFFDPTRHEAIQQIETTDKETGTVLEQYQKGYFLHDRLIRPALVAVAKRVESVDNGDSAVETVKSMARPSEDGSKEHVAD